MQYALTRREERPVRIISWEYPEPGILSKVQDSDGKAYDPGTLIPIGKEKFGKLLRKWQADDRIYKQV